MVVQFIECLRTQDSASKYQAPETVQKCESNTYYSGSCLLRSCPKSLIIRTQNLEVSYIHTYIRIYTYMRQQHNVMRIEQPLVSLHCSSDLLNIQYVILTCHLECHHGGGATQIN